MLLSNSLRGFSLMLGAGVLLIALPWLPAQGTLVDSENGQAKDDKMAIATFGGGCFWCVEAVFERLKGVSAVVSGYEGGHIENPTYEMVCTKRTGHIEVCQIHFDPAVISYEELLKVFFKTHDPTTRDKQGNDEGPQYRSVIFYHDDEQKNAAETFIAGLNDRKVYGQRKVVTDVRKTEVFYEAEDYHQDYFAKNPNAGYCRIVVRSKVDKVESEFADKLKDEAK